MRAPAWPKLSVRRFVGTCFGMQTFTCVTACAHGSCTGPNTCTCDSLWSGALCDVPVCNPTCSR